MLKAPEEEEEHLKIITRLDIGLDLTMALVGNRATRLEVVAELKMMSISNVVQQKSWSRIATMAVTGCFASPESESRLPRPILICLTFIRPTLRMQFRIHSGLFKKVRDLITTGVYTSWMSTYINHSLYAMS